jgi:hypothetical protein
MTRAGFPHSDILGSRFVCQLPEAYRRLPRPSSAPSAKASTLCPYKLDHKDHSKRCSRPLCSSQATTGHRTPHRPPTPTTWSGTTSRCGPQAKTRPPAPTGTDHRVAAPSSQPSGCSLRTQQRAKPTPHTRWTFVPSPQQAAGVLEATDHQGRPVVDVPPSSTTTNTFGRCAGLDTLHHP